VFSTMIVMISVIFFLVRLNYHQKTNLTDEVISKANLSSLLLTPEMNGYTTCINSESPNECSMIHSVWGKFRSKKSETADKLLMFSPNCVVRYDSIFSHALYSSNIVFQNLRLSEKMKIVNLRKTLLEIYTKEELQNMDFEKLKAQIFIVLNDRQLSKSAKGLEAVKFKNDSIAIGVYLLASNIRGVTFEKIEEKWLVNPLDVGDEFDRIQKKREMYLLKSFGSHIQILETLYGNNIDYFSALIKD